MNIPRIAIGPGLPSAPGPQLTSAEPAAVLAKAAMLERLADLHLNEGRGWHADRLSHMASELRCRVLGRPA